MHGSNTGYKAGQHYVICDSCGMRGWSGQMATRWDGKLVHNNSQCFEERHPQDLIHARSDTQSVKDVRNPPDVFTGPTVAPTTVWDALGLTPPTEL